MGKWGDCLKNNSLKLCHFREITVGLHHGTEKLHQGTVEPCQVMEICSRTMPGACLGCLSSALHTGLAQLTGIPSRTNSCWARGEFLLEQICPQWCSTVLDPSQKSWSQLNHINIEQFPPRTSSCILNLAM